MLSFVGPKVALDKKWQFFRMVLIRQILFVILWSIKNKIVLHAEVVFFIINAKMKFLFQPEFYPKRRPDVSYPGKTA
jgi:hypothetical protein